ncbi:ATP-binding protein [Neobacillus sp. Marseille-QA0830]
MKDRVSSPRLVYEEKKALKLFLWLFYICFFGFEIFWFYILPKFNGAGNQQLFHQGLGIWLYFIILCLLPFSLYQMKKGNTFFVKYLILFIYILVDVIDNVLIYFGTTLEFASGNIVELLFILFSPIFVSEKYFWAATLGITGKYVLIGLILQDSSVLSPIVIIIILSIIAYIFLNRFDSYIKSLTGVYEELRKKEKLAVMGQMSAAIAHEIKNPLSSLKGFLQLQNEKYPNTNDHYSIMVQEIDRINTIVNDLMYIGRPRRLNLEKVSIEEIIHYTASLSNQRAIDQGISVETEFEEALPRIDCDKSQLKQVFINIIKNAIEAMPDGGHIKIKAAAINDSELQITIEDEGYGISKEHLPNLGEPFFSTKKDGTGLGLMVINQIIKEHKGEFTIESNIDNGTKVSVILPITLV